MRKAYSLQNEEVKLEFVAAVERVTDRLDCTDRQAYAIATDTVQVFDTYNAFYSWRSRHCGAITTEASDSLAEEIAKMFMELQSDGKTDVLEHLESFEIITPDRSTRSKATPPQSENGPVIVVVEGVTFRTRRKSG